MARLSYSAPGVYVEEVPSAQQPIAGVGTSTAAFIGVVPDVIQYPVRNENYNPRAAQIQFKINYFNEGTHHDAVDATDDEKKYLNMALQPKGKSAVDSTQLNADLKRTEAAQAQAQREFDSADAAFKKDGSDANKQKRDEKLDDLNKAKEESRKANVALKRTVPEATAVLNPDDVLKPYVFKTFDVDENVKPLQTKLCTNFTEFTNYFGPFSVNDPGHSALALAVYGFFLNGGMRCFVARVTSTGELENALKMVESIDEVALVAAPGFVDEQSWSLLEAHCELAQDRFAILDCQEVVAEEDGKPDPRPALGRLDYDHKKPLLPKRSNYAAFYFPWIEVVNPAQQLIDQDPALNIDIKYQGRVYAPPSGHIAGIYARTDVERGVHKAPANCAIRGAINVKYYLSKQHQEGLNPQGVNAIRNINGNVTVWGARTIGGDHNLEWKYINVRRTMLFIRESIDKGTQWVVFEPNDIALWGKIRLNVRAFLTIVWRSGALFGATAEEAFYVKCDAELNPPEVRDLGQVITEIGVAIVRPAEFVIFRISQSTGAKV